MGWLIPSEVQPLETRSVGQSFATAVNFLVGHRLHLPALLDRSSRADHKLAGGGYWEP